MPAPMEPQSTIYRYEVPVDDQWHSIPLTGNLVHVAARRPDTVEFWALVVPGVVPEPRWFRVFGTGDDFPAKHLWGYCGTAIATGGSLVWHLVDTVTDPTSWA